MGASIGASIVSVGIGRILSVTLSVSTCISISVVSIICIAVFYTLFYIVSFDSISCINRSIYIYDTYGPYDRELLFE